MNNSICDYLRELAIENIFSNSTFQSCWSTWKPAIARLVGSPPTATNIINLGDELSNIFRMTSTSGRGQSSLSGGGNAWEGIVCWYLNICLIGSRTVVIKQNRALIPEPIKDALTVSYGSSPSNTESDIVAITFPKRREYTNDKSTISIADTRTGQAIPNISRGKFNYKPIIDALVSRDFNNCEIGVIQCKTNWNDNAQTPMLWDMIYFANGFHGRNITVGNSTYSIRNIPRFTYSFVTVPTSRGPFNPTSLCVKRVFNISGGNYWGRPSVPSVANSIKDIFGRNFANGANNNLVDDLNSAIPHLHTDLSYFRL